MDSSIVSINDEPIVYGAMPPDRTTDYIRTKKCVKQLVSERGLGHLVLLS